MCVKESSGRWRFETNIFILVIVQRVAHEHIQAISYFKDTCGSGKWSGYEGVGHGGIFISL